MSDCHLLMGTVVDRYQIVGTLGIGAAGVVYAVRHTSLGVDRAMKVVNMSDSSLATRLVREGTLLAQLHHPNVVAIHDVIDITAPDGSTRPALILDRVDGPTLDDFLRQAHPERDDAIALWTGIVAGVAAAHAAGVVHRDLKPANVLLDTTTSPPTPRVADFGLATATPGVRSNLTGMGFMGTFGYAAPEQFGQQGTAGTATDVFSLGILGFEILTGRHPFADQDPSAVVRAMRNGTFDRTPALLREPAGEVVLRCLSPDPKARPLDAGAVLALLAVPDVSPSQNPVSSRSLTLPIMGIACLGIAGASYSWLAKGALDQQLQATQHDLLAERADTHPSHAIAHARAAATLRETDTLNPRWIAERIDEGGAAWHFPAAETPYTSVIAAESRVIAASAEGHVTVWESSSGQALGSFNLGMRVPTQARSNLAGTWLIVGPDAYLGGSDSHVVVRSLPEGRPLASIADTVITVMGTASGERACVTTVNAEGKSKITILKAPDWGVDGRADTTRMPLGTETHQWTGCGDNYWMHPTEAGLQVDFFDGRSQLYEGVHTFDATATQDGLYFPQDGAVKFIAVDGTEAWFRPSPEPLELFASLSDAGLFVGRTPTSGWTIHGPSGHVSHIPGLVQWGRGHTVPLVVGLRDGRVQRHNGDLVTSHSGADGRILAVSESTTGLLAASGLGGGASAWPASRSVTGELSRRQARNGSWLGTSTDVVWADGARVLRTIGDAVHEVAVLPEEALLVSGDQGSGVAAMGRTGLYALIDGVVLHSGTHAGRVWPRATPVLLKEQLVEVTSLGLLVHRGDEELLRTLEQLELVEPSPSGDTLWLATGRDETAVVSRMNASLTVTPLSHDVNDAVGVAFMAPQPDGGGLVGTWSGHTLVWQGDAPVVHRVLGPIEGSVNAIDRHNDRIAVGGWHGTVHVFDAEQRAWSAEIGARISSIAWSPSGDYLAVGDDSGGLTVFDSNGEHLSIRTAHRHPVDVRWQAEGGPVTLDTQGIRIQWRTAELVETLSTIQAAGGLTNIRICQDSQQAVPVVPYPSAESVWAPAHLCQALENP